MDGNKYRDLQLSEVVAQLRRAGHIWFRNDDLLLLEELIRRAEMLDRIYRKSETVK